MIKEKIGILGWYGHRNAGDESYKLSFPALFPQYDCVFVEKVYPEINTYILGGGDIVCDHFLSMLKDIPNKHIMSASISKSNTKLDKFKTIAVRDMQSVAYAAASGVMVQYVPDFAFGLSFNVERGKELIKRYFAGNELYTKVVTVVLNSHLLPEHSGLGLARQMIAFENLSYQLSQAIDNTPASFLFLPFGMSMPWDDRVPNSWVATKCKFYQKNSIIYEPLTVQDTIDIIAASDAVVSTRLHSSIFSCVTGTPFIDITHNHKNKGFLDTIGMVKVSIPYESVSYNVLTERLKTAITDTQLRDELTKIASRQRVILKEFTQQVKL
jgi:polysaccharide pyruvyl transferase WcaK-like protein